MQQGPTIRLGLVAEIADYAVTIVGDTVTVAYRDGDAERAGELVTIQRVPNLARFVERARELRVVLAQFPDFEVVYLFDLAQDSYGYTVNLQVPSFSEWGTAPARLPVRVRELATIESIPGGSHPAAPSLDVGTLWHPQPPSSGCAYG